VEGVSGGESIMVMEVSDCGERRSVVIFPEKKEQNDLAIELDGREFGNGMEELIYSFPERARIIGSGVNQ